jgi:GMP synthase (glutamine-hydrolysing)
MSGEREFVAVIDFGAQYGQLIARRIREARVYCRLFPSAVKAEELRRLRPGGIVLTGGPASVYEPGAPALDPEILELGVPVLGICYGMQLLAHLLGGRVAPGERREYGRVELEVLEEERPGEPGLLSGFGPRLTVWMSHGDLVLEPPPGFRVLARTPATPVAAMGDDRRRLYGVQFHPEVAHTPRGREILARFLFAICGLEPAWTPGSFVEEAVEKVRREAGEGRALSALSGGVDSTVASVLVHRAIGERLTCLLVDHGLLREGEAEEVLEILRELGLRVELRREEERFLRRLRGVRDPEEKRRIVGEEFGRVFEEFSRERGPFDFLVQGTLYPDVIESGPGQAAVIKTHHNVGGLPPGLPFRLLEPLRDLFKDEVREVGRLLGIPEEILWRHPFPGPGLAVRCLGEVTREKIALLRRAEAIVEEETRRAGLYRSLWQAFPVLLEDRTVGVMGDARVYGWTLAVRAVESEDGMTADWARLPYELLERLAARLTREIPGITRVVYDVTSKPPATIEWE